MFYTKQLSAMFLQRGSPGHLNRVQISLCAHTLLHILYVMNVHQAFWICNSADTNMHAQVGEIPKILASSLKI